MAQQAVASSNNAYTPGLEQRRKRREAVHKIIALLEDIRYNEEVYLDNIPENLQESGFCENAEHSAASIRDAIETLEFAY